MPRTKGHKPRVYRASRDNAGRITLTRPAERVRYSLRVDAGVWEAFRSYAARYDLSMNTAIIGAMHAAMRAESERVSIEPDDVLPQYPALGERRGKDSAL